MMLSPICRLVVFTYATEPETVSVPVTDKLSSIVTVPPAESIVRFPEVVSIVFALVTPIFIASAVTPAKVTVSPAPTAWPIEIVA